MGEEFSLMQLFSAAYRHLPVTPENSKAVRAAAWAVLATVLASDYLNRWNEAADKDSAAGKALLEEAQKAVDKLWKIDKEKRFALGHYAQGLIHRVKSPNMAMQEFEEAIKCDRTFARAYAQKGSQLINKANDIKDLDEALKFIDKAIKLGAHDRSVGMFYWNRGRAYFFRASSFREEYDKAIKAYDKAIKALEIALHYRPNLWHNWLYLVSAYALKGKSETDNGNAEPGRRYVAQATKTLKEFQNCTTVANASRYTTIDSVEEHEIANPTHGDVVRQGRKRFYEGLRLAGLDAIERH